MVELFLFLFGVVLISAASWEDIRFMRISPEIPIGLFVVESVWAIVLGEGYRLPAYCIVLGLPLYALWRVDKLGGGDVKLGVALAAVLAASSIEIVFFFPFLLVSLALWALYYACARWLRDRRWPLRVPAAPAMLLALMWCGLRLL